MMVIYYFGKKKTIKKGPVRIRYYELGKASRLDRFEGVNVDMKVAFLNFSKRLRKGVLKRKCQLMKRPGETL